MLDCDQFYGEKQIRKEGWGKEIPFKRSGLGRPLREDSVGAKPRRRRGEGPWGHLCKSAVRVVQVGKPLVLYLAPAVHPGLRAGSTRAQRGVRLSPAGQTLQLTGAPEQSG